MTLARTTPTFPLGGYHGLECKIYPNGETVIYKPRSVQIEPFENTPPKSIIDYKMSLLRVAISCPKVLEALGLELGLSILGNFDKTDTGAVEPVLEQDKPTVRYGLTGITPFGARRVRNACHLMQRSGTGRETVFATCTVPNLPLKQMEVLHENWHKLVDAYRRKLTRVLKQNSLSGESVTVTEVQGKRYDKTGLPVLHIHTVFVGRKLRGSWAVTAKAHDEMWRESLSIAIGEDIGEVGSACNLQRVKKSAEGYLGKYMTKGTQTVRAIIKDGFQGWLPKQWWSCTRSLAARIDAQTLNAREFAYWLNDVADIEGSDVWLWHRDVVIELDEVTKITVARYGRISIRQLAEVQAYYKT